MGAKNFKLGLILLFILSIVAGISWNAQAFTLGIIDSGVDWKHDVLKNKIWTNPGESENQYDDDGNGLIDDIVGWNFADNNNEVIDYRFLGQFPTDIYRFFHVQSKMLKGTVNSEEIIWMRSKVSNLQFRRQLGIFGNFIHGTHVAGIAADNIQNEHKILSLKIMATETKEDPQRERAMEEQLRQMGMGRTDTQRFQILGQIIEQITDGQMKFLGKVFEYVHDKKVSVANGSFGIGYHQVKLIMQKFFQPLFGREPTAREIDHLTSDFFQKLLSRGRQVILQAPQTLFVFAAGNDGSDNDIHPVSPANIEAPNVITVGATFDRGQLAKFSNYGRKEVDVAAPGVSIRSSIPGNDFLEVSGTSQAAPFVANLAGKMKDINPGLTPEEMKAILIQTVDVKDFLRGKMVSNGIVNENRAVRAAELRLSHSLDMAIALSLQEVNDRLPLAMDDKSLGFEQHPLSGEFILPLPTGAPLDDIDFNKMR